MLKEINMRKILRLMDKSKRAPAIGEVMKTDSCGLCDYTTFCENVPSSSRHISFEVNFEFTVNLTPVFDPRDESERKRTNEEKIPEKLVKESLSSSNFVYK
ncbi:hypothetical protein RCL_jg6628.t1 [Rhizophagus clarus]|uniref:Uncharacterized protein n=1 Tax=Rhizophagus clarus TaxID=94130 RepID=A0A8H3LEG7_9GLOM|nr:hypothetical protein RCL_jg6628.t1 [Rhizophagus clarus]